MKTVFVGMSGGVDSSVAAARLLAGGYRVIGVFMKNWTQDIGGVACSWQEDFADAKAVAAKLGVELRVFDFQNEYKHRVVDYMVAEYQAGRTPNPDIMCNQEIKFKLFLETALDQGADLIATGHYARVKDGRLFAAVDKSKDQTYFLYRVTSTALRKTLFPLGDMTKVEVRAEAAKLELPTATKPDSQGICFVGQVGLKPFLQQYIPTTVGDIILKRTGETIGQHDGAIFYTIGQRHGLGVGGGKPYFVIAKNVAKNQLFVTDDADDLELNATKFKISDVHWITEAPKLDQHLTVRARHRGEQIPAKLQHQEAWTVELSHRERAISPGQSAVVYAGEEVLGGGIISAL
jgi:tRNA-specific 2-thiouridylase